MPDNPAKVSLLNFSVGLSVVFLYKTGLLGGTLNSYITDYWIISFCLQTCLAVSFTRFLFCDKSFPNAIRACALGCTFTLGWLISNSDVSFYCFGWYICCLAFFHWSEYFCTALFNPKSLILESYLLNHSREYHIAAVASWLEFSIEWMLGVPGCNCGWISALGLLITLTGETLRKLAMITASSNFNHYVQHVKRSDHELVTSGIYGYMRHPSYVGWFLWSVGTQVMLCNPICLVAYTYVSWRFFKHRIETEEIALLNFFGNEYVEYQKNVPTGLPLIKGWIIDKVISDVD